MEKTYFVPETMSALTALEEMQRRRVHMAVVVDEYGGTAGLVTFEDILEEVSGILLAMYWNFRSLFQALCFRSLVKYTMKMMQRKKKIILKLSFTTPIVILILFLATQI
jgi:hypothetical protein